MEVLQTCNFIVFSLYIYAVYIFVEKFLAKMSKTYTLGRWVTADLKTISKYVKGMRRARGVTHPSLLALQDLIETDPEVNMLFTTMFTQEFDPPQENPISDYMDMLQKMQTIITSAPEYGSTLGSAPLNHILIYVMATPSGTMAFINDKVNKCFRNILNDWAQLLNSPDSREVLNKQVNETGQYNYKRCHNWAVRFNTKS